MKIKKTDGITQIPTMYGVFFWHVDGWTMTEVFFSRIKALEEMHKQKVALPDWKYRVFKLKAAIA